MPHREDVIEVVGEWVAKAENDLTNASRALVPAEGCPTDTVCFHAQQCIEKYLKALLASFEIAFPRTHDVGEVMSLLPRATPVSLKGVLANLIRAPR
jgi:HEPN domain-containing protein